MKLVFHFEEGHTEEFLVDKKAVIVGRGTDCDVILRHVGFSRRHAAIEVSGGEIFVTDLGSTNGVYIDGNRIPPKVKTSYQTYLSLQIGSAYQVSVTDYEDVQRPLDTPPPLPVATPLKVRTTQGKEPTKTIRIDTSRLKKPSLRSQKKEPESSKLGLALLPCLVLGAGILYYMKKSEVVERKEEIVVEQSTTAVPIKSEFLSAQELLALNEKKSCSDHLKKWCEASGILKKTQEGVVIQGETLIVYMNMTLLMKGNYADAFMRLNLNDRLEVLTLRRAFESNLLRALERQTTFKNVQIVSGQEKDNVFDPNLAIKINRDFNRNDHNKFYFYGIFDLVLNQGKTEELDQIRGYYSKLPLD